ncbi:hypothetical protein ACO0QE_001665 [Hanseniaspora vineae]
MGVHKLWDILEPSSKPVRLESLNDQRLAVDASIWLYQFLTAVRDKEGNSLQSAHLTGFFRRICKLLYFGIKPVFVFDGAVSPLKKDTIKKRNERRQGKRDDAAKTAKKLLALQLQNSVGSSGDKNTPRKANSPASMARSSKKPLVDYKDEWELPALEEFKYNKTDGRLSSMEEYQDVLNQIDDELTNVDLDSINPASKEFGKLPASTQYMILYALRMKSRLRMGYSKEQLEEIFPSSMDFSKFQIDMVQRRNFFTQKLLDSTGLHGQSYLSTGKIANEKNKEYQLIRTDTGWALSLENDDGSSIKKAIKLDDEQDPGAGEEEEEEDGDDLEWEEVDVDKAPEKEVIPDYSIKASLLASGGKISGSNRQGGQAFLDKRFESPSQKAYHSPYKKTVEYIDDVDNVDETSGKGVRNDMRNEVIKNSTSESNGSKNKVLNTDDKGDEDDYKTLVQEIEIMHSMKEAEKQRTAKSDLSLALREESVMTHQENKAAEQGDDHSDEGQINERFEQSGETLDQSGLRKHSITTEEHVFDDSEPEETAHRGSEPEPQRKKSKPAIPLPTWFDSSNVVDGTRSNGFGSINNEQDADEEEKQEENRKQEIAKLKPKTALDFSQWDNVEPERVIIDDDDIVPSNPVANEEKSFSGNVQKNVSIFGELESAKNGESTAAASNTTQMGIFGIEAQHIADSSTAIDLPDSSKAPANDSGEHQFSEDEEEDLKEQMQREENEYNTFLKPALTSSQVASAFIDNNEPEDYTELLEKRRKQKRDADEVTTAMIQEVQELLSCFGIPFVTAPMEAEAQCAELLHLKLVDGIITDDSDIFLFAGDNVYRKMFQEKNYVEFYDSFTIKDKLGLERMSLIELAHLLGSDYTEGVKSIGPVSAIEILAHFGDLQKFRDWYNESQFNEKKLAEEKGFEKSLRKKLVAKQVMLDAETFPSTRVTEAYLYPVVDQDKTKFVWGNPDLGQLRALLKGYVGWTKEKSDQVLIPLIRDMNKRKKEQKQKKVTDFFHQDYSSSSSIAGVGKRMESAMVSLRKKRGKK